MRGGTVDAGETIELWRVTTSNWFGSFVGIGKTCCMDCKLVTLSAGPCRRGSGAIADPMAAPASPAAAGAIKEPTAGPSCDGKTGSGFFFFCFLLPHLHSHLLVPEASEATD